MATIPSFRSRRQDTPAVSFEDPSLWHDLGITAASGLQFLGETLNKGSRALWGSVNYMTGGEAGGGLLNLIPFSDSMGLTDPRQGVELSNVVERAGFIPANQEGFDRWDIPRVALDIAGDPLSWIGPGTIGKVGKLAKQTGVLDDAIRGTRMATGVGRRQAAMNTTLRQALDQVPDMARRQAAWETAEGLAGGRAALDGMLDMPLGSALTWGVPFSTMARPLGTGRVGQTVAKALDFPGNWFGKTTLGRVGRAMFDPSVMGKVEPEAQQVAEATYHATRASRMPTMQGVVETQQAFREGLADFIPVQQGIDAKMTAKATRRAGRAFKVGDEVQWTVNGADQFPEFRPIKDIQKGPDGKSYAMFEGSATGVPVDQLSRAATKFKVGDRVIVDDLVGEVAGISDNEYRIHHRSMETGAEQFLRVPKTKAADRMRPIVGDTVSPIDMAAQGKERARVLGELEASLPNEAGKVRDAMRVMDARAAAWARANARPVDEFFRGRSGAGRFEFLAGDEASVGAGALRQPDFDALEAALPQTGKVRKVLDAGRAELERSGGLSDASYGDRLSQAAFDEIVGRLTKGHDAVVRSRNSQSEGAWAAVRSVFGEDEAILDQIAKDPDRFMDAARPQVMKVLSEAEKALSGIPGQSMDARSILEEAKGIVRNGEGEEVDDLLDGIMEVVGRRLDEDAIASSVDDLISKNIGDVLYQGGRGAVEFNDVAKTARVTMFKNADISTFAHESGHLFRRSLRGAEAPLLQEAERALGVVDGNWTREAEEAFASGFERYLKDGKAPVPGLKGVFEKFKEWMANIYASIVGTPLEKRVPPRLRKVFDKMLSSDDAVIGASQMVGRTRAASTYEKMVRAASEGMNLNTAWTMVKKQLKLPKNAKLPAETMQKIQEVGEKLKARRDARFSTFLEMGGNSALMSEIEGGARQTPRYVAKKVADEQVAVTSKTTGSTTFGSAKARQDEIRNVFTVSLNDILRNPKARDLAEGPETILGYDRAGRITLDPNWSTGKNPEEVFSPAQLDLLSTIDESVKKGGMTADQAAEMRAVLNKQAHAEALATWARDHAQRDLFTRDMPADEIAYATSIEKAIAAQTAVHDVVRSAARPMGEIDDGVRLADAFRRAGMKPAAVAYQAKLLGVTADEAANMAIPRALADAIVGVETLTNRMTEPLKSAISKAYTGFTRLFKESVTTQPLMPGYFVRNAISALYQNVASGQIKTVRDIKAYAQAVMNAWRGAPGMEDELRQVFGFDDFLGEMRDFQPQGVFGVGFDQASVVPQRPSLKRARQEAAEYVAENPGAMPDAVRRAWGANTRLGQQINANVEYMNRVPMYLFMRGKGYAPDQAKQMVDLVQFDYSDLTGFEKDWIRNLIPFYSFSKKQAQFMARDLVDNPGGVNATLLKVAARRQDPTPDTPDYVAASIGIPVGEQPDGSMRYVNSFGLPIEDTARLFSNPLADVASRLNPLIKGPLELATGRSFFQSGRDLRDMEGPIGRTAVNVTNFLGITDRKESFPVPGIIEQVAANTPASKALNTVRTLTDERKEWWNRLDQFFTGVKATDVSPGTRAATLQQRVDDAARARGGKPFTRVNFAKGTELTPDQLKIKAIYAGLAKQAKARAAEREKNERLLIQMAGQGR